MNIPEGTYTVLLTPFFNNGAIDFESLDSYIEYQLSTDVTGFVILGTTSESVTLSHNEKLDLVKFISNRVLGYKFLICGVGGNNTLETLYFARECVDFVNGIMVTVPYYNKPPQRGIIEHFKVIAGDDMIKNTPVMLYTVKSRTGIYLEPETTVDVINSCPNVVAIKEADGSIDKVIALADLVQNKTDRNLKNNFKIFSGDDINIYEICEEGGSGVISVAASVIPETIYNITNTCLNGNPREALVLQNKALTFIKLLFAESNPIPVKEIMHKLGIFKTNYLRLPMVSMENEELSEKLLTEYYKLLQEEEQKI